MLKLNVTIWMALEVGCYKERLLFQGAGTILWDLPTGALSLETHKTNNLESLGVRVDLSLCRLTDRSAPRSGIHATTRFAYPSASAVSSSSPPLITVRVLPVHRFSQPRSHTVRSSHTPFPPSPACHSQPTHPPHPPASILTHATMISTKAQ